MSSLARKIRRGKADQFGRAIPKRLYNNKKRTKGRQNQVLSKANYEEMVKRIRYIKSLILQMRSNEEKLEDDTWIPTVRKYDKHQLIFDDYEKGLMFQYVNA